MSRNDEKRAVDANYMRREFESPFSTAGVISFNNGQHGGMVQQHSGMPYGYPMQVAAPQEYSLKDLVHMHNNAYDINGLNTQLMSQQQINNLAQMNQNGAGVGFSSGQNQMPVQQYAYGGMPHNVSPFPTAFNGGNALNNGFVATVQGQNSLNGTNQSVQENRTNVNTNSKNRKKDDFLSSQEQTRRAVMKIEDSSRKASEEEIAAKRQHAVDMAVMKASNLCADT